MNTRLVLAFATAAGVTAGMAATPRVAHAGAEVGAQFQLLPVGQFNTEVLDRELSIDTDTAFALQGSIGGSLTPNLSLSFAPRYILGIRGEDADEDQDTISQLDLAARLTGKFPVAPTVELHGFFAPGYSFVMVPDDDDSDIEDPDGFIVGIGGGAGFRVNPSLTIVGEIGYTFGFQSISVEDDDFEFSTDFLHVGVGILAAL